VQAHRQALHRIATSFDRRDPDALPLSDREIDILRHEYDQNIAFARDTETHRSAVMTFVVAGIGAVVYALAALKFNPFYWPVPLIGTLLGAYAAFLANIYHERWMYYMMIARGFRWRLAAALPGARIEELRVAAKAAHGSEFRTRRRLYIFWNYLAVAISLVATACSAAMLIAHLLSPSSPL
jgi:fatty acid desaturase